MSDPDPTPTPKPPGEPDTGSGSLARVQISLDLDGEQRVRITIEALDGEGHPSAGEVVRFTLPGGGLVEQGEHIAAAPVEPGARGRVGRWLGRGYRGAMAAWRRLAEAARSRSLTLGAALFGLALALYLGTRLAGLEEFPIYFFTDEAVHTILAADLVRDNFFDYNKTLLPTYFQNGPQYNLGVSVYLHLIPYLFFGKSVLATRALAVLVSLLAPVSVGLILRNIFRLPYWWSGALLLSIAPAWFLHSRTGFETVLAVSFYAAFLYAYLLYRFRDPRFLYAAVALAGLTFYTYSPAQVYVAVTAVFLALSDAGYHWRQRPVVARAAGVLLLVALPYLRFRLTNAGAPVDHLRILGSYWVQAIPLRDKLLRYGQEYLYGLSPGYWFVPNERDLSRHLMQGYGHLMRATLPFAALGLVLALRHIRKPEYRLLLLVFLAAPTGAAVVEVGITRLLVFVIPATLLTALGLSQALTWLERLRLPRPALALGVFAALGLANLVMARSALEDGPTWYQEYGLGGMQYGARQVFPAVAAYLEQNPDAEVVISPTWANGTDVVARFFIPDSLPYQMAGIAAYLLDVKPFSEDTLFVLPVDEYQRAVDSGKFTDLRVERVLYYPNRQPGFYFLRMRYVDNITDLLAAERAERAELREARVVVDGEPVLVRHSMLDMGEIANVFDGDDNSVARTMETNPGVFELHFSSPRSLQGYAIIIGSSRVEIKTSLWGPSGEAPQEFSTAFQGSEVQPEAAVTFPGPIEVERMRIEVLDTTQVEWGHVHVWELRLQ